ncbi:MAG: hypothetical protein QXG12_06290 [Thermoproteota archaeon]
MENLEKRDLDVYVNFGLIARGRLGDILKLKMRIRELIERDCQDLRIIYNTITAEKLWLVKKREMGDEQGRGV